jgi:hypothetical protein
VGIFSKLFGNSEKKEINIDETIREAFRLGESIDSGERSKAIQFIFRLRPTTIKKGVQNEFIKYTNNAGTIPRQIRR